MVKEGDSTMSSIGRMFLGALAALSLCSVALAHDDATLSTMKAPNGGQVKAAGPYHLELVVARDGDALADRPVVVHDTGHDGTKIDTHGATASATLLSSKGRSTVPLSPAGGNTMKGMAKYASTQDLKAVVSLTMPGKEPQQARFEPLAAVRK
jgi:hypothetical protein